MNHSSRLSRRTRLRAAGLTCSVFALVLSAGCAGDSSGSNGKTVIRFNWWGSDSRHEMTALVRRHGRRHARPDDRLAVLLDDGPQPAELSPVGGPGELQQDARRPPVAQSLSVTFVYVVLSVPLLLAVALALAMVLNRGIKGLAFYRSVYYLPSLLGASVAVGILWRQVFGTDGLVNKFLGLFGIHGGAGGPLTAGREYPQTDVIGRRRGARRSGA